MKLWLVELMLQEILTEYTSASGIHKAQGMAWKPKNNSTTKARCPRPISVGIRSHGVYAKNALRLDMRGSIKENALPFCQNATRVALKRSQTCTATRYPA